MVAHRSVSIDDDTVVLELERVLKWDEFHYMNYVPPESDTSRRLRDKFGNEAAEFNGWKSVTFTDTRKPTLLTATVDGTEVVLTFDEALDPDAEPLAGSFPFTVDPPRSNPASTIEVNRVEIVRARVSLTLSGSLADGESGFIDYRPGDGSKRLQDLAGNLWEKSWEAGGSVELTKIGADGDTPMLAGAAVDGAALTLTYDEKLDRDPFSVPSAAAFTVTVDGSVVALAASGAVAVGETSVALTLAEALRRGNEVVTVDYVPAGDPNPIRDLAKNPAEALTAQAVANVTDGDQTPPALERAAVDGAALTLTYGEKLNRASVPAAAAFTVTVDGGDAGVGAVAVGETAVTLTLAQALGGGERVTVAYAVPSENPIQDLAGNAAGAIPERFVANATADGQPPMYRTGTLKDTTAVLTYSEALDPASTPPSTQFNVVATKTGGAEETIAVNGVSIAGARVSLTLARAAAADDAAIAVDYYAQTNANRLQDYAGEAALGLNSESLRSVAGDNMAPRLTRAVVNGAALTLTYNEKLDRYPLSVPAAAAFAVTVDGGEVGVAAVAVGETAVTLTLSQAVTAGEQVTVAYAVPSENPIQDLAGNDAEAIPTRVVGHAADKDAPVLLSVTVDDDEAILTYNEPLDPDTAPAANAYQVLVGGVTDLGVSGVEVAGQTVTLTLTTAATADSTYGVTYNDARGVLRDYAGNRAARFTGTNFKIAENVTGDSTPPELTRAVVNGDALTLTYDKKLDRASVPAASAFTVTVDGGDAGVAAVAVGETAVTLTLATAVTRGERVTVAYAVPAVETANRTQDLAGNDATAIPTKFVGNATPGETGLSLLQAPTVNGAKAILTYNEPLDPDTAPAANAYQVLVGGVTDLGVSGVEVAGQTVTLTLTTEATADSTYGVTYNDARGVLRDYAGNRAAPFTGTNFKIAENVTGDSTPPELTRAVVNGDALTLTYDKKLDRASVPAASAFTVTVDGGDAGVAAVAVGETAVTLTLAQELSGGKSVKVAYVVPSVNPIQDLAGHDAAAIPARFVGNATEDTVLPVLLPPPLVNGDKATLTYSEPLDPAATPLAAAFIWTVDGGADLGVNAVDVAGRTVTLDLPLSASAGQSIEVKYDKTAAGDKPVQDYAGNEAAGFPGGETAENITGDSTPPRLTRAAVDGAALTLSYGEKLDRASVPAAIAFTVTVDGGDRGVAAVAVGATSVTLALAAAVLVSNAVTVAYAVPSDNPIRDLAGHDAAAIAERTAHNVTSDPAAAPSVRSATLDGKTLTVVFSEALDPTSKPAGDTFTIVDASDSTVSTGTGTVGIDDAVVTVALDMEVTADSKTMKYAAPVATENPLQDLDGNAAGDASVVIGSRRSVAIASVAITSTPSLDADGNGAAESYGVGDAVDVTVTWDDYVTWDVSASSAEIGVALKVSASGGGKNTRTAKVATGGATRGRARELVFRYVVRADDVEPATPRGIEVVGGTALVKLTGGATLETQNGTVRRTAGGLSADLGHQVRGGVRSTPRLTRAAVDGSALTLSYGEELDPLSVPAAAAFTVTVNGVGVALAAVGAVAVGETAVTLTLAEALAGGERVTVDYAAPTENPIQDLAGNEAASFSGWLVGNPAAGDTRTPVLLTATVDGTEVVLTYDEALDPASTPPAGAFQSTVDIVTFQDLSASVAGRTVTLSLATAPAGGESLFVIYTPPAEVSRRLADYAGNLVAQIRTGDLVATDIAGDETALTLSYGETLDRFSVPAAGAFTVTVNGVGVALAASGAVAVGETAVTLTLAAAVLHSEGVTVDYAPDDAVNPIRDLAGNAAAGLSGRLVGNATAGDTRAPVLLTATVDGTEVVLTYDEALDPDSTPAAGAYQSTVDGVTFQDLSASVAGRTVTLTLAEALAEGESLFVIYTPPGEVSRRLADYAGNLVAQIRTGDLIATDIAGDETAPALTRAVVDGTALALSYGETLDRFSVPAAAAFTVTVNGVGVALAAGGAVAVGETAVTLTLAAAVLHSEGVTVDYAPDDAVNPIRDLAGNAAAGLSGRLVGNATAGDTRAPVLLTATVDGTEVVLTYDEALDPDSTPPAGAYQSTVDGVTFQNLSASVAGRTVTLSLPTAPAEGESLFVVYTPPAEVSRRLADYAGNLVAQIRTGDLIATDIAGDMTAPALTRAVVDGTALALSYGETLDGVSVPAANAFTVTVNGNEFPLAAAAAVSVAETAVTLTAVTLTLAEPVLHGDAVKVAYTVPTVATENRIEDLAGNDAAAIAERAVDNVTPDAADETGPKLVHVTVDASTLTMVFDEALDPDSAPAGYNFRVIDENDGVSTGTGTAVIDGAVVTVDLDPPVTAGQVLDEVRYFQPSENPLQDLLGNRSGHFNTEDFRNATGDASVPAVGSVAITSTPSLDMDRDGTPESYGEGETVEVTVTWDHPVTWDVSAAANAEVRVPLQVSARTGGTSGRAARLARGVATRGTARTLVFGYDVQVNDVEPAGSPRGIEVHSGVSRTVVRLRNGATLTDFRGDNASVTHAGLGADLAHQVQGGGGPGGDTTPPRLVSGKMEFIGSGHTDGTRVTLHFSEALDPATDTDDLKSVLQVRHFKEQGHPIEDIALVEDKLVLRAPKVWIDGSMRDAWVKITDTSKNRSKIRDLAGNHIAPLEGPCPDGEGDDCFALVNAARPSPGSPRLAASSAAVVNGAELTLTFDQKLDPDGTPDADAFEVSGTAADTTSVTGVHVEGMVVTLTLGAAVGAGETGVRLSYSRTDGERLRNLWGTEAAAFDRVEVVNVGPDTVGPALVAGTIDWSTVNLLYDEPLYARGAPRAGQFTLTGSVTGDLGVSSARVHGGTVTLMAAKNVTGIETVTAAVDDPAGIRDLAGNGAAAQSITLTNSGEVPERGDVFLQTSELEGATLTLTFDKTLDPTSVPAASAFGVFEKWQGTGEETGRTGIAVDAVAIDGKAAVLTLRLAPPGGAAKLYVGYDADGGVPLQNLWRRPVNPFGPVRVTSPGADVVAPTLAKAEVAGKVLTLHFDEALDANFAPPGTAFSVRATALDDSYADLAGTADATVAENVVTVTLDGAVKQHELLVLDYDVRKAGGEALRDAAGNRVASIRQARAENVDVYPPKLLSGTVNGTAIELHFSEAMEDDPKPAAGDFEWSGAQPGDATAIGVTGSTIALTVPNAVSSGQVPGVNFTAANDIRDLAGNRVARLDTAFFLANVQRLDPGEPMRRSLTVDGAYLTIAYDRALDAGTVPALAAFDLASFSAAVAGVAIENTEVILALGAPVPPCEKATVLFLTLLSQPGPVFSHIVS